MVPKQKFYHTQQRFRNDKRKNVSIHHEQDLNYSSSSLPYSSSSNNKIISLSGLIKTKYVLKFFISNKYS